MATTKKVYGRLVMLTSDQKEGKIVPVVWKRTRWGTDPDCEITPGDKKTAQLFSPKVAVLEIDEFNNAYIKNLGAYGTNDVMVQRGNKKYAVRPNQVVLLSSGDVLTIATSVVYRWEVFLDLDELQDENLVIDTNINSEDSIIKPKPSTKSNRTPAPAPSSAPTPAPVFDAPISSKPLPLNGKGSTDYSSTDRLSDLDAKLVALRRQSHSAPPPDDSYDSLASTTTAPPRQYSPYRNKKNKYTKHTKNNTASAPAPAMNELQPTPPAVLEPAPPVAVAPKATAKKPSAKRATGGGRGRKKVIKTEPVEEPVEKPAEEFVDVETVEAAEEPAAAIEPPASKASTKKKQYRKKRRDSNNNNTKNTKKTSSAKAKEAAPVEEVAEQAEETEETTQSLPSFKDLVRSAKEKNMAEPVKVKAKKNEPKPKKGVVVVQPLIQYMPKERSKDAELWRAAARDSALLDGPRRRRATITPTTPTTPPKEQEAQPTETTSEEAPSS